LALPGRKIALAGGRAIGEENETAGSWSLGWRGPTGFAYVPKSVLWVPLAGGRL